MNPYERDEFAEQVAQAVIDRIEARDRVVRLAGRAIEHFRGRIQGTKEETSAENIGGAQGNAADAGSALDAGHPPESLAVRRVILRHSRSPGDVLMLTAAVRDLVLSHPGRFEVDVRTPFAALWENNPYLTPLRDEDPATEALDCDYCDHPLISQSNQQPYHFIHAFRLLLEQKMGVSIHPQAFKGDIHLTDREKGWLSQVDEITGEPGTRFWIIASGGKTDFTAKWWDPARSQAVVDHFRGRIQFVQVGAIGGEHVHPPLDGVINLLGKTDIRQMVRLMYHANGVVCPVTMLMHLAAAVETKPGFPRNRPCVVIAGGREPTQWEAYPHHQYLHTLGMLPCCDDGGCWRSRVVALGDGAEQDGSLCLRPVTVRAGLTLPQCLDMITAERVISTIEQYLAQGNLQVQQMQPLAMIAESERSRNGVHEESDAYADSR